MKSFIRCFRRTVLLLSVAAATAGAQVPATQAGNAPNGASPDCADLPVLTDKVERADKILHDWPNLARYAEANAALTAPAKFELRVVFMGDSITDAWISPQFGGFFPGKAYVDRGISGQTTPQMLVRFRPDVIALQPKVVVILAGTNDIAGNTGPMTVTQIEANLASMAELAVANKIHVVLASLLPVSNYGHDRQGNALDMRTNRPPEKILALNAWMKKYATDNRHTYLDYFSAMADPQGLLQRELSEDGLHPNAKGYELMSPLAEQAIRAALKKKR